jgi:hypothetical protein
MSLIGRNYGNLGTTWMIVCGNMAFISACHNYTTRSNTFILLKPAEVTLVCTKGRPVLDRERRQMSIQHKPLHCPDLINCLMISQ